MRKRNVCAGDQPDTGWQGEILRWPSLKARTFSPFLQPIPEEVSAHSILRVPTPLIVNRPLITTYCPSAQTSFLTLGAEVTTQPAGAIIPQGDGSLAPPSHPGGWLVCGHVSWSWILSLWACVMFFVLFCFTDPSQKLGQKIPKPNNILVIFYQLCILRIWSYSVPEKSPG